MPNFEAHLNSPRSTESRSDSSTEQSVQKAPNLQTMLEQLRLLRLRLLPLDVTGSIIFKPSANRLSDIEITKKPVK